jgi:hypothetical protein
VTPAARKILVRRYTSSSRRGSSCSQKSMGALRPLFAKSGPLGRSSEGGRVLDPRCHVKASGIRRGTKRRRPVVHRLGTTCGEYSPNPGFEAGNTALERGAHRRKAPRVQPIADLFAEDRGKRPFRRRRSRKRASGAEQRRASGVAGGLVTGVQKHVCTRRRRPLQPMSSRARDKRCSSGSGRGEASAASNRDRGRRESESSSGPWPLKPRLDWLRKGRVHPGSASGDGGPGVGSGTVSAGLGSCPVYRRSMSSHER